MEHVRGKRNKKRRAQGRAKERLDVNLYQKGIPSRAYALSKTADEKKDQESNFSLDRGEGGQSC